MKKKVMMFLMAVMMSFSAMCYASYGTDLDAEAKMVDQFFAGGDYKKVVNLLDPDLAKEITADRYKTMFADLDKELGKMVQKDLISYRLYKEGHVLNYAAKFDKGAVMVLEAAFKMNTGKPAMISVGFYDPNAQAQAPAQKEAAKK